MQTLNDYIYSAARQFALAAKEAGVPGAAHPESGDTYSTTAGYGTPANLALPAPNSAAAGKNLRPQLHLTDRALKAATNAFFGAGFSIVRESLDSVAHGQTAPKQPISVKMLGESFGKFLVREFPAHVTSEAFVDYVMDFHAQLAVEADLAPHLLQDENLASLYTVRLGDNHKPVFTSVQHFLDAQNLTASYTAEGAGVAGKTLADFHSFGKDHLKTGGNIPVPDCMQKTSRDVLMDLFGWVRVEFEKRHADPSRRAQFANLYKSCVDEASRYALDVLVPTTMNTLVHGDFQPANVIVDSQGAARLVDFDDLRLDHPAADVAHALCQMMVFKFFESGTHAFPSTLSDEAAATGHKFLQAYFGKTYARNDRHEILTRLQAEIPLALLRGLLLGFLDERLPKEQIHGCMGSMHMLVKSFAAFVDAAAAADAAKPHEAGKLLWAKASRNVSLLVQGMFKDGNRLFEEYYLEMADPEHQYAKEHIKTLVPMWMDTDVPSYFDWMAKAKIERIGPTKVAYLTPAQADKFKAEFRDGYLHFNPAYPQSWRKLHRENNTMFLFVIDRHMQLFVGKKRATPFGKMHHCSFTAGAPVRAAGFMYVGDDMHVEALSSESGHYQPSNASFYATLKKLSQTHKLSPSTFVKDFAGELTTLSTYMEQAETLSTGDLTANARLF